MAVVVVEAMWLSTCNGCGHQTWSDETGIEHRTCNVGFTSERYHRHRVNPKVLWTPVPDSAWETCP